MPKPKESHLECLNPLPARLNLGPSRKRLNPKFAAQHEFKQLLNLGGFSGI